MTGKNTLFQHEQNYNVTVCTSLNKVDKEEKNMYIPISLRSSHKFAQLSFFSKNFLHTFCRPSN